MKQTRKVFFFCLAYAILTISCTPKLEQTLAGKWQEINGREGIEFLKDGTFHGVLIWDLKRMPLEVSGTYKVKGDLLDLRVQKPKDLIPMTWKVSISPSGEMTIVFQQGGALKVDGSAATYRKAG